METLSLEKFAFSFFRRNWEFSCRKVESDKVPQLHTLHQQPNWVNEREMEIKKHQRTQGWINNSQCQRGVTRSLTLLLWLSTGVERFNNVPIRLARGKYGMVCGEGRREESFFRTVRAVASSLCSYCQLNINYFLLALTLKACWWSVWLWPCKIVSIQGQTSVFLTVFSCRPQYAYKLWFVLRWKVWPCVSDLLPWCWAELRRQGDLGALQRLPAWLW